MATLQTYLTATQRLLRESNFKYWAQPTLIDAINGACKRVVGDSACNRQLQTVYFSGGLELYGYGMVSGALVTNVGSGYVSTPNVLFSAPPTGGTTATGRAIVSAGTVTQVWVTNGGSGYTTSPSCTIDPPPAGVTAVAAPSIINPNTLDTLNITVRWGTERVILNRMAYTQFQATVRSWMGYTQRPGFCTSYGANQWYIGPIPDQTYATEWDTIINPTPLVNLTDVSVIQYPFEECVAFYAAHTAKLQEQSYAEADHFLKLYTGKMLYSRRSVMLRMLPSAYAG